MKTRLAFSLAVLAAVLSIPALAHDPSQHKDEKAAPPDCSQIKDMDMSRMDPNDPVMRALHEKCSKQMQHLHGDEGKMKDAPGTEEHATPHSHGDDDQ